jgi:hypothetical protein
VPGQAVQERGVKKDDSKANGFFQAICTKDFRKLKLIVLVLTQK